MIWVMDLNGLNNIFLLNLYLKNKRGQKNKLVHVVLETN